MNGCKYCNIEPNGDIPDDRRSFWYKKILSIFGRNIDLQLMITTGGNVEAELLDREGRTYSDTKIIKINYCPMCGRRLGGDME